MSSTFGVFLMLTNYFHDLGVAIFFTTSLYFYFIFKNISQNTSKELLENLTKLQRYFNKIFLISFFWILIAGIPRFYFFKTFEWNPMLEKSQVPALIAKHLLLFFLTFLSFILYFKTRSKLKKFFYK